MRHRYSTSQDSPHQYCNPRVCITFAVVIITGAYSRTPLTVDRYHFSLRLIVFKLQRMSFVSALILPHFIEDHVSLKTNVRRRTLKKNLLKCFRSTCLSALCLLPNNRFLFCAKGAQTVGQNKF